MMSRLRGCFIGVYGAGQRQYFYVLDLDVDGGPVGSLRFLLDRFERSASGELGSTAGGANEPLNITSTIELPADEWALVASDANRALLRHNTV